MFRKRNRWARKRYGKLTRHHNLARSRNGGNDIGNIIWLTAEHHQLLHKLFGNRTLTEIIAVLERLETKRRKKDRLRLVA